MGQVRSLRDPVSGLEEFCNFLFGEEVGFVHLPIKDYESDKYEYNFFFKWPVERQEVIEHVERYMRSADVFIAPGMFKSRSSSVAEVHGSYVAWCDFDGNAPSLEELQEHDIPLPTLRVQSSVPGHEHWYWRFEQFNTDIASIQGINRALSYILEADIGAWDAGHSTRPVGSYNHKRGSAIPVIIRSHNSNAYRVEDFSQIPVPENSYTLEQFRKEQIPSPIRVMMKYGPWPEEATDLFTKARMAEGTRSSALTALTYYCCEQGLDNSEVYSILQWKDKRWGKFYNRLNSEKYYVDLINYARQKVPYEGIKDVTVLADELKVFSFKQVLDYVDDTHWIISGILPYKGTAYLVGRPGTGKTTLALGLCTSLALNKQYLKWESSTDKKYKVLYLSLEMPLEDVNQFFSKLQLNFSDEELEVLNTNFYTYASPEKVKFYQPGNPVFGKFLRTLENLKPDILLVDSASYALASNLSAQDEVTKSLERIDMLKDKYGCSVVFIHHSRKEPPGHGYKEADLDDVFGSAFIAASASSIISIKQSKDFSNENPIMDIRYLKTRFKGDSTGFSVVMDGDKRIFKAPVIGELMAAKPSKSSKSVPNQKREKNKKDESLFQL